MRVCLLSIAHSHFLQLKLVDSCDETDANEDANTMVAPISITPPSPLSMFAQPSALQTTAIAALESQTPLSSPESGGKPSERPKKRERNIFELAIFAVPSKCLEPLLDAMIVCGGRGALSKQRSTHDGRVRFAMRCASCKLTARFLE